MADKLEYNWAGKNPASPEHPMAVRLSDGTKFPEGTSDSEVLIALAVLMERILGVLDDLTIEQRITNLHLGQMTGEVFRADDTEECDE